MGSAAPQTALLSSGSVVRSHPGSLTFLGLLMRQATLSVTIQSPSSRGQGLRSGSVTVVTNVRHGTRWARGSIGNRSLPHDGSTLEGSLASSPNDTAPMAG